MDNPEKLQDIKFFDVAGFIDDEIVRLDSTQASIKKIISLNNDRNEKALSATNWKKELNIFKQADINKPSWKDSYTIDTFRNKVIYTANDDQLFVKKVVIDFDIENRNLTQLKAEVGNDNFIFNSQQTLVYIPNKGYSIKTRQKFLFINEQKYEVVVAFL